MITQQPVDFVEFIRQYDVSSADYTKIYDEYMDNVQYEIKSNINDNIIEIMKTTPRSIIITGNAGDGKTRICRNVYEALTGNSLKQWSKSGIETITYDDKTFHIVKDLSELPDAKIYEVLKCLQETMTLHNEFYIIAANEGKLTYSLYANPDLVSLLYYVIPQFANLTFKTDAPVQVFNLLHTSSSVFAQKIIEEWNTEEHWEKCKTCEFKNRCIIFYNHNSLANKIVKKRMNRLYRSLDALEVHITMRELLIQLAYVQLGGLSCEDVKNASVEELREQAGKVYYQNLFGVNCDIDLFNDIPGVVELKKFDSGRSSNSTIDDFIMNGDLAEKSVSDLHHDLYDSSIDTEYGYFKQTINDYRMNKEAGEELRDSLTTHWLPRLRRKYFFEAEHRGYQGENLIFYKYRKDYLQSFKSEQALALDMKDKLVQGLNNYFAKHFVYSPENALYVVSEKLYVYRIINCSDIKWEVEKENLDYNRRSSVFYIKMGDANLKIDLSIFEYLCRIADGGLYHILHEYVEIRLQNFKNQLLQEVCNDDAILQILKYDASKDAYRLQKIEIFSDKDEDDDW